MLLLRGQNALNRFDVASEIREDLLGKVLGPELNKYTFEELRGNREILTNLGSAIQREISGILGTYGLKVQDYSISWGLNLQQRASIEQQRYQVNLDNERNIRQIERIRSEGRESPPDTPQTPLEVVLKPSMWAKAIAVISIIAALIFLTINSTRILSK